MNITDTLSNQINLSWIATSAEVSLAPRNLDFLVNQALLRDTVK